MIPRLGAQADSEAADDERDVQTMGVESIPEGSEELTHMADRDIYVRAPGRVGTSSTGEREHQPDRRQPSAPPAPPVLSTATSQELAGDAASTSGRIRPAIAQMMVDEHTQLVYVRIIDPVTNELIRTIPSDEVERVSDVMRDYSGLLLRRQLAAAQQKPAA